MQPLKPRRRPRQLLAWQLRLLLDQPLLLAIWFAVGVAAAVAAAVIAAAGAATAVQTEARIAMADLMAEATALAAVAGDAVPRLRLGPTACSLLPRQDGGEPRLLVEGQGLRRRVYGFEVLPGGAPAALALPFAYAGDPPPPGLAPQAEPIDRALLPRLAADLPDTAQAPASTGAITADDSIALLRLRSGTDRRDYQLGRGDACELPLRAPGSGVVAVDGNLWIDAGARPLRLRLDRDLTLVVRGNVYVGRSVLVRGGRLLLVAVAEPGQQFRDLDGDCRWSSGDQLLAGSAPYRGPQEGSGGVFLGFADVRPQRLQLDLGLVVQGELHLAAAEVQSCGPILLFHGCTRAPGTRGRLLVAAERLPLVDRELVPGFAVSGPPRPGLLRLLHDDGVPLYPAAPAR